MANKKAVLGRPLPNASVPRNAFDRSSRRQFHYALGQLVPAWWEPVIAGSKLKLNRKMFQRTADVNTAAFPKLDTHVQYYFVPFRQMWSFWDDFKLGIQDTNSSALFNAQDLFGRTMPTRVPYTTAADFFTTLDDIQQNSLLDDLGYRRDYGVSKILNLLGYGQGDAYTFTRDMNLWPILAYHKIYYDHFRNTAYEPNLPHMYNMDYLWAQNRDMKIPQANLLGTAVDNGLFSFHYVNYRNDYFNNLYPSLNYIQVPPTGSQWQIPSNVVNGVVSSVLVQLSGSTGTDVGRWATNGSGSSNINVVKGESDTSVYLGDGSRIMSHDHSLSQQVSLNANQILNPQAIRAAFALDKLLRSSAYAPKHAKQQYEARFGIKFKNNPNESFYLGSFMNDVTIGEVTTTATTNFTDSGGNSRVSPTGAIGGKGIGFGDWGKTIDFTAEEDGIVMAIVYSTIRSSYRALGVDSYLSKHLPEDYFQPEFQDLGLEPVYGSEFNQTLTDATILGYRPRNQRYKIGIDKNYLLFMDMQQDLSMFINHTDVGRIPANGSTGVPYSWFKVKPSDLNGIMRVNFNGQWNTDQFITDCEFGFTCIQNMSVHGQPKL